MPSSTSTGTSTNTTLLLGINYGGRHTWEIRIKLKLNIIIISTYLFKTLKSPNIGNTLNSKNYPIFLLTMSYFPTYTSRKINKQKKITPGRSGKFGSHVKTCIKKNLRLQNGAGNSA